MGQLQLQIAFRAVNAYNPNTVRWELYVPNTQIPCLNVPLTAKSGDIYELAELYAVYVGQQDPRLKDELVWSRHLLYTKWYQANKALQAALQAALNKARVEESDPEPELVLTTERGIIGWKTWDLNEQGMLTSMNDAIWHHLKPLEATCRINASHIAPHYKCSCGIYAGKAENIANGYNDVLGKVRLWGKFWEGEQAWRAQYAYPDCFILEEDQMGLFDQLKLYRVPIYVKSPIQIYDPKEDGYANGQETT